MLFILDGIWQAWDIELLIFRCRLLWQDIELLLSVSGTMWWSTGQDIELLILKFNILRIIKVWNFRSCTVIFIRCVLYLSSFNVFWKWGSAIKLLMFRVGWSWTRWWSTEHGYWIVDFLSSTSATWGSNQCITQLFYGEICNIMFRCRWSWTK